MSFAVIGMPVIEVSTLDVLVSRIPIGVVSQSHGDILHPFGPLAIELSHHVLLVLPISRLQRHPAYSLQIRTVSQRDIRLCGIVAIFTILQILFL